MGLMRKLSAVSLAAAMMAPFALPVPQALAETLARPAGELRVFRVGHR
jgi:hypothetical protein